MLHPSRDNGNPLTMQLYQLNKRNSVLFLFENKSFYLFLFYFSTGTKTVQVHEFAFTFKFETLIESFNSNKLFKFKSPELRPGRKLWAMNFGIWPSV